MPNIIGEVMNLCKKWKDVKCPYCHQNKMWPFFGYDNGTKELVTLCCHNIFHPEDLKGDSSVN